MRGNSKPGRRNCPHENSSKCCCFFHQLQLPTGQDEEDTYPQRLGLACRRLSHPSVSLLWLSCPPKSPDLCPLAYSAKQWDPESTRIGRTYRTYIRLLIMDDNGSSWHFLSNSNAQRGLCATRSAVVPWQQWWVGQISGRLEVRSPCCFQWTCLNLGPCFRCRTCRTDGCLYTWWDQRQHGCLPRRRWCGGTQQTDLRRTLWTPLSPSSGQSDG